MKLDGGQETTNSCLGGILSFILVAIILLFTYQKFDVFLNKKDVDILSTINENFIDEGAIFDTSNGFAFAAAFTAYDGNQEPILLPEYGEVVFKKYFWGQQPDGTYKADRALIPYDFCTQEELGLEDGQ